MDDWHAGGVTAQAAGGDNHAPTTTIIIITTTLCLSVSLSVSVRWNNDVCTAPVTHGLQ